MTITTTSGLTESQRQALETLIPLTEEERLDARDRARQNVIRSFGPRPKRDTFKDHAASEYPAWLTYGVGTMLLLVFFAAANVSIFRVFTAGRDHFMETINIEWQAAIVGASSFLLAEFMVIAATVAMRIYFKGRDRWLMLVPILMGLLMAFVGNWAISQPTVEFSAAGLWSILETATPPAAVLFMAIIGERLILETLRNRHRNEQAFQAALAEWQELTAEPEKSPRWRKSYANALKEMLRETNGSGRGQKERREWMQQMRGLEWSVVVMREMQADQWFEEVDLDPFGEKPQAQLEAAPNLSFEPVSHLQLQPVMSNGNGRVKSNGHSR